MSADGGVLAVAKALSEPLTKLIEVCANGLGRAYEPTHIRRVAKADGDAMLVRIEAELRRDDLALRAAQRLFDAERQRQMNIEAIVEQAQLQLPTSVSSDPVGADWATRFFGECQDVADEQMQQVWGKVLAGEIAMPRSFSRRTLSILKNLSQEEAQSFNVLCKNSFKTKFSIEPFIYLDHPPVATNMSGLSFEVLGELQDTGLIAIVESGIALQEVDNLFLFSAAYMLHAARATKSNFLAGNVRLTRAGDELASVCEWEAPRERVDMVVGRLEAEGFAVSVHKGTKAAQAPD